MPDRIKVFLFPSKEEAIDKLLLFAMIVVGALVVYPIVKLLPMLGWDWFYYFNGNNHALNVNLQSSIYLPYTTWILSSITWLDWRSSLAILNALTLVAIALGTWQQGGRWLAVFYAIFNPPVLILLWVGHPDGLVLIGVLTGLIPLTFIKPQVAVWSFLSTLRQLVWVIIFFIVIQIIWPDWLFNVVNFGKGIIDSRQVLLEKEATFGWGVFGFPAIIIGLILIIGAGSNPFRLMAAGCLLSPYLMPYHLAILIPIIGKADTALKQSIVWLSTWLIFFATAFKGYYKLLIFIFPITAFVMSISREDYKQNVSNCLGFFRKKQKI